MQQSFCTSEVREGNVSFTNIDGFDSSMVISWFCHFMLKGASILLSVILDHSNLLHRIYILQYC